MHRASRPLTPRFGSVLRRLRALLLRPLGAHRHWRGRAAGSRHPPNPRRSANAWKMRSGRSAIRLMTYNHHSLPYTKYSRVR